MSGEPIEAVITGIGKLSLEDKMTGVEESKVGDPKKNGKVIVEEEG